ncbi:SNF2-related protein [Bacillus thuringiensis]|nr:SNF2-related protein [Bacillus thuringiensis]MEC3226118.1 SNF2-related protein [Bacillus thuringiensis]MEC3463200.1 SNF2-related protein [Bacillus thuringiensis]MEC3555399.1 SNF2-related protein [Bacillus thuringiensis]MED2058884.1 SNF2-related protein [Bacillus thuringiensis]
MSLKEKLIENGLYRSPEFSNNTHKELYEIYFQSLNDITSDEKSILKFMKFTGQIYKYPFEDSLFIYGQNPNSTFLADYDTWKKIGRNVKFKEKAIHSLTFENGRYKQKYFFDVSQTVGKEYNFPEWDLESKGMKNALEKMGTEIDEVHFEERNIEERIEKICESFYKQIEKEKDYGKLAIQSSKFILLNKLGIEVNEESYYSTVSELVDNIEITTVMNQVIELNQNILGRLNELKNELKEERELDNGTVSTTRERDVNSESGRLSEQQPTREVRNDGGESSEKDKLPGVLHETHQRSVNDIRSQGGRSSVESSREIDSRIIREESNAEHRKRAGENKIPQSDQDASGRNSEESADLQLNKHEMKSDEQIVPSDFFNEDEITNIIQRGSGIQGGKFRINSYFLEKHTAKERVEFLKKEYGIGGGSALNNIFEMHDAKGIELQRNNVTKRLSWTEVAKRIDKLVTNERYMSKEELMQFEKEKISSNVEEQQITLFGHEGNLNNEQEIVKYDYSFPIDANGFYGLTNKEKIQDNIAAIQLLKELEKQNRLATPEEQEVLVKYVGWGGLVDVFDNRNSKYDQESKELKELLTEEEYQSARESVLTAYYTDPVVIQNMYNTLQRMGFKGGNVLDPAMGTGNFFSAMPEELKNNASLYGVEIDPLTGNIAKHLHQTSNIQVTGFEKTDFQKGSFDVVVGNIPFDNFRLKDSSYKKDYQIHDYFIKKSLDLVREDGIVAFISSAGTMDKRDYTFREEISKDAELLGAVRLPNNTFKKIAGTEVTTDIIFFQKKSKEVEHKTSPDWVFSGVDENHPTISYNNYFIENKEQVLGDIAVKSFRGQTLTVNPKEDEVLYPLLEEGLKRIEGQYIESNSEGKALENNIQTENEPKVEVISPQRTRPFTFIEQDKEIFYVDEGGLIKQDLSQKAAERIKGMIQVRKAILDVIEYQQNIDYKQDVFQKKLKVLNTTYDDFVKNNGYLNDSANTRAFRDDDMQPLLLSIENQTKDGKYGKADVFHKATIRPTITIEHVDNAIEALDLSISQKMKVDMKYMRSIYPKTRGEIIKELENYIFINPEKYEFDSGDEEYWETRDEYLTGNVKEKLKIAEKMDEEYPGVFSKNIKELQEVIPEDLKASEIDYKIGANWIPEEYYKQFMFEMFETPYFARSKYGIQLEFNSYTDMWFIKGKTLDNSVITTNKYGTNRATAYKIFEDCLNLKNTEVRDPENYTNANGEEKVKYVLNPNETMLAREKQEQIQEAFKSWLFNDPHRSNKLLRIYNDRFNCIRPRTYDGSKLQFNGMNEQFELRSHQKDVVARIVQDGRALMAHEVGAGKTASMISAGMLMKEKGMIKKPLYVVPNHLTQQFGQELLRFYPSKNVLVTTKDDFKTNNRKKFTSRIATGDYDAVIIGHSQFEKISLSKEYREKTLKEEVKSVQGAIEREKLNKGESWSLKQMVRFEKNLKQQLKNLQNEKNKDDLLTFEQLGVDFMFVDEAHIYKNLYTYTKLSNVAGVNTSSSLRASDMHMKCQYLLETNNNRGVVFATGTPISNSMSEMYTMQRYLQPDVLKDMGIGSFDSWASTFGEVTSSLEITPEGSGFQMKNRFAKFHNLPELMNSFNLSADIQTADMLKLPVPEIKGGKAEIIVTEATDYQMSMMDEFADRAELIRARLVQPHEDNMLKLTHEAKLMAIDPRLIDENAPSDGGMKLKACCDKVHGVWQASKENKSTQMIFSDSGTPKTGQFNVYDEIKRQLIEKGIPENEIVFIHDAKTDKQRDVLFDKVRKGDVRVLLGSTSKVGTGTNVQNKLLAVHHIDCPWRPSDLTQRDGRIVRQGNENSEVQIYRYVTKNSFDSYLWQIQEQKLKYITQVMTGKSISRSCDDLDETVLSASEVKAVATGNPLLAEKMNLDIEVTKLRLMKSSWIDEQMVLKNNLTSKYPIKMAQLRMKGEKLGQDDQTVRWFKDKDFSIELVGKRITEKSEAGKIIEELAVKSTMENRVMKIGKYKDFELSISPKGLGIYSMEIKGYQTYEVEMSLDSGIGTLRKIDNELERIPGKIELNKAEMDLLEVRTQQTEEQIDESFKYTEKLETLLKRQTELNLAVEIGMNQVEKEITDDASHVEEKSLDNSIHLNESEMNGSSNKIEEVYLMRYGALNHKGEEFVTVSDLRDRWGTDKTYNNVKNAQELNDKEFIEGFNQLNKEYVIALDHNGIKKPMIVVEWSESDLEVNKAIPFGEANAMMSKRIEEMAGELGYEKTRYHLILPKEMDKDLNQMKVITMDRLDLGDGGYKSPYEQILSEKGHLSDEVKQALQQEINEYEQIRGQPNPEKLRTVDAAEIGEKHQDKVDHISSVKTERNEAASIKQEAVNTTRIAYMQQIER